MRIALFCLLFMSLSGCGAIERQRMMKEKYPHYPAQVKRAIDGKYLIEGMTMEQTYLAIGGTMCKSSSYYAGERSQTWSFQPDPLTGHPMGGTYDCLRARQSVHFREGKIIGWDNMPF